MSAYKNKAKYFQKLDPYFDVKYDSKERFCSYWHQINEIISLKPKKILEVGIGTGFVARYLKGRNINVTSLDIAHKLKPDVTGSVLAIPFKTAFFDVVSCYEVLEHLPYKNFKNALIELSRISKKHIILSLPDVTAVYRYNIELPRIKAIKMLISHPFPRAKIHKFDNYHYWEIGKKNYPLKKIEYDIILSGLKIIKTYRVFESYRHRLFLAEKEYFK